VSHIKAREHLITVMLDPDPEKPTNYNQTTKQTRTCTVLVYLYILKHFSTYKQPG